MLLVPYIRLATRQDASRIAEMSRDYIEQGLEWSWREARVLSAIHDRATNAAVIVEDETVAGFGIMQYGADAAHLALFAIHPAYRNRGFGSRLLCWLEKPAAVAAIARIRVEARADNEGGLAFYRKHGYNERSRFAGYYQGFVDAVRLERRL